MAPETLLPPLTALTLLSLPGVGRRTAWRLLESGPLSSNEQCLYDTLRSLSGVAPRYQPPSRETFRQARSLGEQTLACCDAHGIAVLTPGHDRYPVRYERMPPADRPLLLYALGDLAALNSQRAMAVVGTRKPDTFARMATRRIAGTLAHAQVVVVSGLALGCDTQAHEGSLDAGGVTVAVLGCGLDSIYPAANTPLAERIQSAGGCLVSEYPPATEATSYRLLERDRLQAALADGVIVAQSTATGGAMHAARYGDDHVTLPLGAIVPANNRPGYDGNAQLIARRGARALRTRDDVEKFIHATIPNRPRTNAILTADTLMSWSQTEVPPPIDPFLKSENMNTKLFSAYREAAAFARDLAYHEGRSIRLGKKDSQFFVELPDGVSHSSEDVPTNTCRYERDSVSGFHINDYDEARREIEEELTDYTESMARSEEDGWYYGEED